MAAMASESATPTLPSPRGGAALETTGAAARSPQYRRRGVVSTSPWTQIVRGPDLELPPPSSYSPTAGQTAVASSPLLSTPPPQVSSGAEEQVMRGASGDRSGTEAADTKFSTSVLPDDAATDAQPEGSDNGSGGGSNAGKKPVWNKPSNGGAEIGPVMGAELWPALSESTRASPKVSSTDLPKALTEGLLSTPPTPQVDELKVTGVVLPSASKQAPTVAASSNSTTHHSHNRPRPLKRNTSNNSSSNGHVPSPSPKGSAVEVNQGNSGRPSDNSSRENSRDGGQRPQLHSGNEQQQQRNSYRRGNGGSHPRGDGPHHHGYGGRRGDQDRGNQDWNPNRSFGGRDGQVQQHRVPARPYIRGPTPTPPQPFFPPPAMSVRPMGGAPIVYPDMAPMFYIQAPHHPEAFRGLSVVPPQMQPVFFHGPDPQLQVKIVNQIEYYFSNENLIKDTYLRQNMDDQGWVSIKLIANFKKVSQLTDNIQLILDSVRNSSAVEVEGEKVRRRNDWAKWLLPSHVQHPVVSSPRTFQKSSQDVLAANLHSFGLDDRSAKHGYAETYLSPSSSGEWSSLSQHSSSDKACQVVFQGGLPISTSNSSK